MAEKTAEEWRAECNRLRAAITVLRGCADRRCSLCPTCLAAVQATQPPQASWPAPHRW